MSDLTYPFEKVDKHGGPFALGVSFFAGGVATMAAWFALPVFGRELDTPLAVAIALTVTGCVLVVSALVSGRKKKDGLKSALRMLTPPQIEITWTMLTNGTGKLILKKSNEDAAAMRAIGALYIPSGMTYTPPDGYTHMLEPSFRMACSKGTDDLKQVYKEMTGEDLESVKPYSEVFY